MHYNINKINSQDKSKQKASVIFPKSSNEKYSTKSISNIIQSNSISKTIMYSRIRHSKESTTLSKNQK